MVTGKVPENTPERFPTMEEITVQKTCSSSTSSVGCIRNKLEFASLCSGVLVVGSMVCCAYGLVLHGYHRVGHQFLG